MSKVFVAIPCLAEEQALPACLDSLAAQIRRPDRVFVCVNQPDSWWDKKDKRPVCEENARTLSALARRADLPITVLDRATKGLGWPNEKGGVGAARAALFEAVCALAEDQDLFVSLDADTITDENYLASVCEAFETHPGASGLAARYLHETTGNQAQDRAILRYEIYLRSYFLNLAATDTPFLFTALGSAIAMPVEAGKKVSGPPVRTAAEDFYLLQKLAKIGPIALWTDGLVRPSGRPSDRVPFGTGPAVAQGMEGSWQAAPIFGPEIFDEVADALALVPRLQTEEPDHPFFDFFAARVKKPGKGSGNGNRKPARKAGTEGLLAQNRVGARFIEPSGKGSGSGNRKPARKADTGDLLAPSGVAARFIEPSGKGSEGEGSIWDGIRANHKAPARFQRACHERLDALRILQYVRRRHQEVGGTHETNLAAVLRTRAAAAMDKAGAKDREPVQAWLQRPRDLASTPVETLEAIRNILALQEDMVRQSRRRHWTDLAAFYGLAPKQTAKR